MNDKIFEYLRTNFSELGLSREILSGYADLLAATVTTEDGIAAAAETIKPLLLLHQKEHDRIRQKYAETRKRAEQSELEADKGDKGDKKQEEVEDAEKKTERKSEKPKGKEDDIPEWAKKLMKEMSDFKAQQKNRDRAMEIGTRRREITKLIERLPKSMQRAYERMDLDIADDDYQALKEDIGKEVDETVNEISTRRAIFNPPYASNGEGNKATISKEKADEIAKRLANH